METHLQTKLWVTRDWKWVAILLLAELSWPCFAQRNTFANPGSLLKCSEFRDFRQEKSDFVKIPANRTSRGIYTFKAQDSIKFYLSSLGQFKCPAAHVETRQVDWSFERPKTPALARDFSNANGGTRYAPEFFYFTSAAYFYDDYTRVFYKPNGEYCISSVFDDKIVLNLCAVRKNCEESPHPHTLCLPKCCAINEVLSMPSKECISVTDLRATWSSHHPVFTGITPWVPPLYSGNKHSKHPIPWTVEIVQRWQSDPKPTQYTTSNVTFQMASLPTTCNKATFGQAKLKWWLGDGAESKEKVNVPDKRPVRLGVPHHKKSGQIFPMIYNKEKKVWEKQEDVNFCADGYFVEKDGSHRDEYRGNDHNFVVVYCDHDVGGGATRSQVPVVACWLTFVLYCICTRVLS